MTYLFLFFVPGAAGNFISRCINLLDGGYCWSSDNMIPTNIKDKLNLLSYAPVMYSTPDHRDWVTDWETKIKHYDNFNRIPPGTKYIVRINHPNYEILNKNIAGPDDQQLLVHIDASDNFEWCILNALYKNSYQEINWFKTAKQMLADNNIYKISLKQIVDNRDTFFEEFKKICDLLNHELTAVETLAILMLYDQWKTTTLDYSKFDEFKQAVGFYM